jgi:uncharacterized membrane protein YqjE
MENAVATLWFLNAFDACATAYAVREGYGAEANPFMQAALGHGLVAFFAIKYGVMTAACAILLVASKKYPRAMLWITASFCVLYAAVACWHIYGFIYYAR